MPYLIGTMISLISWSLVFLIPGWSLGVLSLLLFLAGFFSGGMILGFAQGKETLPLSLSGTVSGVINMGVLTLNYSSTYYIERKLSVFLKELPV